MDIWTSNKTSRAITIHLMCTKTRASAGWRSALFRIPATEASQTETTTLRSNLLMALAAALSVAVPYYFPLKWEASDYQRYFPDKQDILLLAVFPFAYLCAAVFLWLLRRTFVVNTIPRWLAVSSFGSVLLILIGNLYESFWLLNRSSLTWTLDFVQQTALVTLALVTYTSLVTGAVYYSRSIFTNGKRSAL